MRRELFKEVEEKLRMADYLISQDPETYLPGAAKHLLNASNTLLKEVLQTDKISPQIVTNKLEFCTEVEKEFAAYYLSLWKNCSVQNPKRQTLIDAQKKIKETLEKLKDQHYASL